MLRPAFKLIDPTSEKQTVTRKPNADLRTREHLTDAEVERLMATARSNRWGHRDATMILVAYRHGLRVSELVDLRWDQVDFEAAVLHVRRVKRGTPSTHPLTGSELRALRRLRRESDRSPFVFLSERGHPFSAAGFARMLERAARGSSVAMGVPSCAQQRGNYFSDTSKSSRLSTMSPCLRSSCTAASRQVFAISINASRCFSERVVRAHRRHSSMNSRYSLAEAGMAPTSLLPPSHATSRMRAAGP